MKPKKYDPKKPLKLNKAGFLGIKKPAAKAKAKENKPIAKKPAKKREGESSIRIAKKAPNPQQTKKRPNYVGRAMRNIAAGAAVHLDIETGQVHLAVPEGNMASFEKAQKHAANYSAAVFDDMKSDIAFIRQNLVTVGLSAIRKTLVESMPPKRRDPLGEETSFDAARFNDCLTLLSYASRADVFFPRDYALALTECRNAGFDIDAMLAVEAVDDWKTADIERLISYLTTLCHIKRAVRSAPETNVPTDIVK